MIEVELYTLALSKWAVMGKANPVLLFGTNNSSHFAPMTAAVKTVRDRARRWSEQLPKNEVFI